MGWATALHIPKKLPAHLQKQVRRMFFLNRKLTVVSAAFLFHPF